MNTLENDLDSKLFSYMPLLAKHYFSNSFEETVSMYTDLLVNYYKDLRNLNPDMSAEYATELSYQITFEGLICEGEKNFENYIKNN